MRFFVFLLPVIFALGCFSKKPYKRDVYQPLGEFQLKGFVGHVEELTHKKSGARLVLIKNSDLARSFNIVFRTPPYDDTGLFHIFEHAVLAGSRLYPSKSNFFHVADSSLATFINALTGSVYTSYPFSTRDPKDFDNLLSVYMDAVFFPKAIEDPRIVKREGHRFEIDPKTGKMFSNGIVFSEMKGAYSAPRSNFYRHLSQILLPETPYRYESGGDPEKIATLKFKQIQQAHKKYYHPQNSLIVLYGDIDFKKSLRVIDEQFLTHFSKEKDFKVPQIPRQGDFLPSAPDLFRATYPGLKEPNKSWIARGWVLGSLSLAEQIALDIMMRAFVSHTSAPVNLSALKKGLAQSVSYIGFFRKDNVTAIVFKGTDESNQKALEGLLQEEINQVIEKGLDEKLLIAIGNKQEFAEKETKHNAGLKGFNMGWSIMDHWIHWLNQVSLSEYMDTDKHFKEAKALLSDKNFVKDFFKKHFKENPRQRVLVMTPDPEYSKKFNQKLEQQVQEALKIKTLSEYKKEDKSWREWVAEKEPEEITNKTPVLQLSDIKTDEKPIPSKSYKTDFYKVMEYPQPTSGISYIRLFFDLKGVSEKDIKNLRLLTHLLKKTNTKNHSFQELSKEIDRYIGGFHFDIVPYQSVKNVDIFKPFLRVNLSFLNENREKSLALLTEVLSHSLFLPEGQTQNLIDELKTELKSTVAYNGYDFVKVSAQKNFFPVQGFFKDLVSGGLFYEYMLKKTPKAQPMGLKTLLAEVFNQSRLKLVTLTAEQKDMKPLVDGVLDMASALPAQASKDQDWSFKGQKNYQGYVIPGEMQYLIEASSFLDEGLKYSGALRVYSEYLNTHFMYPRLREQGGAYSGGNGFSRNGLWILASFKDPHLKESFNVFSQAVDFMKKEDITQKKLKRAIMGALKPFYQDRSIAGQADFMTALYLQDLSWDDYIQTKKEILSTTPKSFQKIHQVLSVSLEKSHKAVSGKADKIKKEAPFLKEVLNFF